MAEKLLQTRIVLKHDTLENWNKDTAVILKEGEIALAKVETNQKDPISGALVKVPTYLIKVGDGVTKFSGLNWVAAPAADVYDWAKKPEAEFTTWVKSLIKVGDIDLSGYVTTTSFSEYQTNIQNGATTVTDFKKVEEALAGKQAVGDYATTTEAQGYASAVLGKDGDAATVATVYGAKAQAKAAQDAVDALTSTNGAVTKNAADIATLRSDIQNSTKENGIDSFADVETELAKYQLSGDYATKTEAQGYAAAVLGTSGDGATANTVYGAKAQAQAAQDAVDALTKEGGQVKQNKDDIAEIKSTYATAASVEALTQEGGAVKANTDAIAKLNGNDQTEGSVDYKIAHEVAKILNDNDASDIDTLNEIAAWITNDTSGAAKMNTDIAELKSKTKDVEEGAEKNIIETVKVNGAALTPDSDRAVNVIVPTGNLASKNEVAEDDLTSDLADKINSKVDTVTFTPVSEQVGQNKAAIAALQTIEHHNHKNFDLLETYTQTNDDLADAVDKKHEHDNADVINEITAEKVKAWDDAEQNATKYADDNFDTKGSAAGVQTKLDQLDASLATIAKSGNVNDLIQTAGDVLVFNCGTSTENV